MMNEAISSTSREAMAAEAPTMAVLREFPGVLLVGASPPVVERVGSEVVLAHPSSLQGGGSVLLDTVIFVVVVVAMIVVVPGERCIYAE
jgi:hypothetical protein